ncbi:chromo domain-containing protein cec-1-like [Scylla paramamosain]|uniref:chromo domain-containing protein cec-1-like n=1 Tax=Scylla paramamosain TaxID=85552 RepID=UPI0030830548
MDGKGLVSSVPPPPTRPRGTDGVFGRFSIGFTGITVLPYSELDAEPLGVLEFLFKYIFFIDVLLGLEVYTPRVADGMAPLTEEEEEAWWEQWEKEMEREEEERRRKLEEEEEGRQKEEEEDYKGIDYWREEEEEEDVEVEEEVEEDKEAVAREQERFLQWVEQWVEEKVGVEDGRPCVQRPQETHGGAILEQYRAAKRIGGQAAAGGTSRSCGGAFPSCHLSVFNVLGGCF